jgi:uncharacterized protein (DUF4213/DUF364 family)
MNRLFDTLKDRARELWDAQGLLDQKVQVSARALSTEEAIGNPECNDFPLQKGKEKLMQAEFMGSLGQAFTDQFGNFEGSLDKILDMALINNYRRAVFVATLNAVLRHMGLIEGTIHCKDQDPSLCSTDLNRYIKNRYGLKKILQIGYQPRMVEALSSNFKLWVIDLDPSNIGTKVNNTLIESPEATRMAIRWADIFLVTGTTLVNGTIGDFLGDKPVIFYGTTIAGAAYLMGWERFCAFGR